MKSKGFALMTVLIIVIIVPIVVFGITFFITSSISRYDAQTRSLKALYLAQSGIHKGIFNLKSTGAALPVGNVDANNQIDLQQVASGCGIYQLKCTGTSVAPGSSISRTLFAQYELSSNKVQIYMEGDGTGIPAPPTGGGLIYDWEMIEGSGSTTGTLPFRATIVGNQPSRVAWVAGPDGAGDYAIRFNITSTHTYATVPDQSALDLTTSGSIEARCRFDANPSNAGGIVHKGSLSNQSDAAYALTINSQSGNRYFALELFPNNTPVILRSNVEPVIGTWYKVKGTWGSSGMKIYINDVLNNSNATVVTVRNTTGTLQFGTKYTNNQGGKEPVTIDDVQISGGC